MHAFWAMGGYAAYVWTSYGLAGLVVAWNVASAVRARREARERALRRLAAAERRTA
jgi:heme exporter protein D